MSQNVTLDEFNYTMGEVAEKLNGESFQDRRWNDRNAKKKFREILLELGFEEKDMANFKSRRLKDGKYIFVKDEKIQTLSIIKYLFNIDCNNMTKGERDSLIHGLISLSPICTSIEQYNYVVEKQEKEEKEIREAILSDDVKARMTIEQKIKDYYDRSRCLEIYENRIFVGKTGNLANQTGRYEFFLYQYEHMKQWSHKWLSIMKIIGKIRMAERFDIGSQFIEAHDQNQKKELESEWKKLCREGSAKAGEMGRDYQRFQIPVAILCKNIIENHEAIEKKLNGMIQKNSDDDEPNTDNSSESDKEKYKTEKHCREACNGFVKEVLDAPLKKISEADFYFTLGRSFDELEDIRMQILEEQNALYYTMKMEAFGCGYKAEKEDLKILREVRSDLVSTRITMINQWQ